MVGKVLGKRYEILEEIGSGGMAIVYKARCKLLKRFVAIKVLREEFAKDEEFIGRFKVESQAAANLSHPNIVSIYDVGSEKDVNYIVMEYVEGITLKEYITENKTLSWQEALDFTKQICLAVECAHKNGTIHRDIKPHNIMVTPDNVLKVMDFGIARAVTSTTMTMSGTTIGSVHYFSPEQARGGYVDEKSDIYSVGIVMYEMLTGKVPFDGESPITIAIKQIQQQPSSPREFNVSIPLAVAAVTMKAIEKDPEDRYQSATEMLEELEEAKKPKANKKAAAASSAKEADATKKIAAIDIEDKKSGDKSKAKKDLDISDDDRKSDKRATVFAIVAAIIVVAMVTLGMVYLIFPPNSSQELVPNLVGMHIDDIRNQYPQGSSFTVVITQRENSDTVPIECVISQTPGADRSVKLPAEIKVVLSSGPATNTLSDYSGKDRRVVEQDLEALGAKVNVVEESSQTMAEGFVLRTVPTPGTVVKAGDEVTVYVSIGGGRMITMPGLVGLSFSEAKAVLEQYNLKLGRATTQESDQPVDQVLSQSVEKDANVKEFTEIDLVLAKERGTDPSPSPSATPTPTGSPTATPTTAPGLVTKRITIAVQDSKNIIVRSNSKDGPVVANETFDGSQSTFTVSVTGREGETITLIVFRDGEYSNETYAVPF